VRASNTGRYVLFVQFRGTYFTSPHGNISCSRRGSCDSMVGEARLCTRSGVTRTFALRGVMHGWWTTHGAQTNIGLTGGAPDKLPSGGGVAFHGAWDGPALSLDSPDNSFTEVFTPAEPSVA